MHPGDVVVIDTHKWFHKTDVLGDEISITVGSEYDKPNGTGYMDAWDDPRSEDERWENGGGDDDEEEEARGDGVVSLQRPT
jgi:hypothetical protein